MSGEISDDAVADAIVTLLAARAPGTSICPSEAARALAAGGPAGDAAWRALMPRVRAAAARLAAAGRIEATQRGAPADPLAARGPIRLRRPSGRG